MSPYGVIRPQCVNIYVLVTITGGFLIHNLLVQMPMQIAVRYTCYGPIPGPHHFTQYRSCRVTTITSNVNHLFRITTGYYRNNDPSLTGSVVYYSFWVGYGLHNSLPLPSHHLRLNNSTQNTTWWRHDMKTFLRYWPFVRGIHRSPVNSPYKGRWRGALVFSLICVCING